MKKSVILISALFLLFTAKAQNVSFGIKGGVNISSLNQNENNPFNSKVGLYLGGLAHAHINETWAIQPEIFYSSEGAKSPNTRTSLNYINVPVLLQYMFANGLRLEAGPQLGFLVSAKSETNNVTVDNKNFKSTAFSIPLGIGYLTPLGLGFDARAVLGLSDLSEDNNPRVRSNVFQLGVFYQFGKTNIHPKHK